MSQFCTNPETEAGIAYAKIKAVYPKLTRDMIIKRSPEQLVECPTVKGALGSVKQLMAPTAEELYKNIQSYVESRERNNHLKRNVDVEFWPLVKVVRIYTKAAALATGAVIVDLPGIQDSNAARAAVAQDYIKSCTGLWIVSPINRAVDDKTAKSLLGNTFKRQLKYDDIYSAVTFICSYTDDISITEAVESLSVEIDVSACWNKIDDLELQLLELRNQLASFECEALILKRKVEELENQCEI
ncbi:uncharacterized protein CTRU02_202666 [Colletotrichum truncatum]|uniref:Uncharacterized protein n=1 Tax=Colletotrichum truncatum TaxID=5467 RepID=A0ACC3ZKY0_COLTU